MSQYIDMNKPYGYCLDQLRRLKYLYVNVNAIDLAIRNKREIALRLQTLAENHARGSGSGSKNWRARENKIAIEKLEELYIARTRELATTEKRVNDWIEQLPVGIATSAIFYHYVNAMPWEDVAEILNRPASNVARTAQKTIAKYGHLFK